MLLSDRDIRAEIDAGRLIIHPFDSQSVQPSSVDLRLDHRFRVFNSTRHTHIDPTAPPGDLTSLVTPAPGEPFVLHPGKFVLGSTLEHVVIPVNLAGRLEGRSSRGRIGLLVHSTAGFIDPGFTGTITLELSNAVGLPITLWPGMGIAQLCLIRLSSPAERPYGSAGLGSRYQGQDGPTAARAGEAYIPELVEGHIYEIYSRNLLWAVYMGDGYFRGIREKLGDRRLDVEVFPGTVTRVIRKIGETSGNLPDEQLFAVLEEIGRTVTPTG